MEILDLPDESVMSLQEQEREKMKRVERREGKKKNFGKFDRR